VLPLDLHGPGERVDHGHATLRVDAGHRADDHIGVAAYLPEGDTM
jgi:hypothetical protein